jgi:hypothetical protein
MNCKNALKSSLLLIGIAAAAVAGAETPAANPPASTPPAAAAPAQPQPKGATSTTELPRETAVENAIGTAGRSSTSSNAFGGYGELTFNAPSNGPSVIDLRRFVLFFGHDFTDDIRFYSEVEVEHAVSSADDQGEVEIEQAYLDGLLGQRLNLRGGVIIMPMGIINVYHEPPTFNGVDRPDVDVFVIPSTWREPGVGVFGEVADGLRYQLYLVNGFNANGFTAEAGVAEGHQEAQLAHGGDFGVIGRLDWEPVLGTTLGASAYGGTSGNSLASQAGSVPVGMFDVDARTRWGGWSARAEVAMLTIGEAEALSAALASSSDPEQQEAGPISSLAWGGYLEAGYDLFRLLRPASEQGLTAFARFDYTNNQADVPAAAGPPDLAFQRYSMLGGLTYRPVPQIALKVDFRHRWFGAGASFNELASAITWLF